MLLPVAISGSRTSTSAAHPKGYYVYSFVGTSISNCYYKGTFWDKSKQMTLCRSQTDSDGEKYAKDGSWQTTGITFLVANVLRNATTSLAILVRRRRW